MNEPIQVQDLTVEHRGRAALRGVSLSVGLGATYALLGHPGAGKTTLIDVVLGRRKPTSGRVLLFGEDAWRKRRRLADRVAAELLVLDDGPAGLRPDAGRTSLLSTDDPSRIDGIASHAGVLRAGRLVLDGPVGELRDRFRRIRYANRITETRTEFGTELDAFDAVRVRVRGWGIDAVVSNFDAGEFERFRAIDGVEDAEALPMTLTEIFHAVAGERPAVAEDRTS